MRKLLPLILLLAAMSAPAQTKKATKPLRSAVSTASAVCGTAAHCVSLSWLASTSSGVTSYNVYRGATSGGEAVYVTGVTTTTYVDTGVSPGATYFYEVTAVCPTLCNPTESGPSNEVTATIPLNGQPAAPTGLTVNTVAKLDKSGWKDVLAWQPSVTTSVVYRVYRGPSAGGPFSRIAGGLTGTSYTDRSTTLGASYWYYVTAYSKTTFKQSLPSNEAMAVIPNYLP